MTYYGLGLTFGIIVGLIIAVVIFKVINKDGAFKTEYDERQKEVRGKAYKYGFWAVLIGNAILMILTTGDFDITRLGISLYFIPILIGIMVQVTYCIFHDGYVGLNTNMTRFMVVMAIISAFNLFVGMRANMAGELIKEGIFQGPLINILCGGLFVILAVELLAKRIVDGKAE